MSQVECDTPLTMEERLKALVYQYVALYERWSEDRQVAVKQGADMAELVELFTEQVKGFKALEAGVRCQIAVSIEEAALKTTKALGDKVGQEARLVLDASERRLSQTVDEAQKCLTVYTNELMANFWRLFAAVFGVSILVSLLTVWLLIPQPTLPLSAQQIADLHDGAFLHQIWPHLSAKEKERLRKLANGVEPLSTTFSGANLVKTNGDSDYE